ncbi:MAG: PQQ-binding-like beta-propeller repeat protein [Pyrinomonadaceae bacterium]
MKEINTRHVRRRRRCFAFSRAFRLTAAKMFFHRRSLLILSLAFALAVPQISVVRVRAEIVKAETPRHLSLSDPLKIRWHYRTSLTLTLSPASKGQAVYLPLAGGALLALNTRTGDLLWRAEMGGEVSSAPAADARGVYVATAVGQESNNSVPAGGTLRALSRESGVTLWVRAIDRPLQGAFAETAEALFAGSADGRVYAFKKQTGEMLWSRAYLPTGFASQPVILENTLFIGNENGTLFAIDALTGEVKWLYRTLGAIRGSIVARDKAICFGSADGKVYAVELKSGKELWNKRTGAGVQSLAGGAEGKVLVASLDNFAYLLNLRTGTQIWKRQLAGRITSQPLIYRSGAVLTALSGNAAVILNLPNGAQLNAVPLEEDEATGASPVVIDDLLLITTRRGLFAYGRAYASDSDG